MATGRAVLAGLKSFLAMIAPFLGIILVVLLGLVLVYAIMIYPATTAKELGEDRQVGKYAGAVFGYLLDDEIWTEELDAATGEMYESYRYKDMIGLDDFQRHQAQSYSLPNALLIGIERVDMFLWDDHDEPWLPNPEPLFQELMTYYDWTESEIGYSGQYKYSYSYSYKYDVYHPPEYDEEGNLISEGYTEVISVSGEGTDIEVPLDYLYEVMLLKTADTFENVYIHHYGDYKTQDVEEMRHDEHAPILLGAPFPEIIQQHVEETKNSIRNSFHSGAYDIKFEFDYEITRMDKTYQPLLEVEIGGEQFGRLFSVLEQKYGHAIAPLDVELIFHIATEYDPLFAYDFAANNAGYIYFSNRSNIQYVHSMRGDLRWPISEKEPHYITSYFGPRGGRFHKGIDIGSHGRNIPILAAGDGVVTFAGLNGTMTRGYGRTVIIDHGTDSQGQRVTTLYAHLHRIDVYPGQLVRAGQQIGLMGTTGTSTGIHLHFEVRFNNRHIDPLLVFRVVAP